MRLSRHGVVSAAVALTVLVAPLGARATREATASSTQTPVMGANLLNATQLAHWYAHKHSAGANLPNLNNDVRALAQIFLDEGAADGVRGDIAFAQSMIETAWLSFPSYGQIRPTFNNFSGLFAFNHRVNGTTCEAETSPSRCFASPQLGVRYQIQLLRGYADDSVRDLTRLIKPPSDRIGAAPYWEQFGGQSGKAIWATALYYGDAVLAQYRDALAYNGVDTTCSGTGTETRSQGAGYWVVDGSGAVQTLGTAPRYAAGTALHGSYVTARSMESGAGFWLVGADGSVVPFGAAKSYGSRAGADGFPVRDLAPTPTGLGYWLVGWDGSVYAYGDAPALGSLPVSRLRSPIVAIDATPTGQGYWLLRQDGGVATFGDAMNFSTVPVSHNSVSLRATPSGAGYWILRSDGTVDAFGDAVSYGGTASCGLGVAVQLLPTPTGHGYWIITAGGQIRPFGDANALANATAGHGGIVGFALFH